MPRGSRLCRIIARAFQVTTDPPWWCCISLTYCWIARSMRALYSGVGLFVLHACTQSCLLGKLWWHALAQRRFRCFQEHSLGHLNAVLRKCTSQSHLLGQMMPLSTCFLGRRITSPVMPRSLLRNLLHEKLMKIYYMKIYCLMKFTTWQIVYFLSLAYFLSRRQSREIEKLVYFLSCRQL